MHYPTENNESAYAKRRYTMGMNGYYSSGEFAKMAGITKKTIRYYDEHNILKPSYVTSKGARYYTDKDFARLQQILLFKYLGFSLDDIKEMTINDSDHMLLHDSLILQKKLVEDRIEQLELVKNAINDMSSIVESGKAIDWSRMLNLIHLTDMEKSMKNQYRNASNISARINLHSKYSSNKTGWFPWIFEHCGIKSGMHVLELGCGDASLWTMNMDKLPDDITITLSDISEGMLRDVKRSACGSDPRFSFCVKDCHNICEKEDSYDIVIANHVLFYCRDISTACKEIARVLKPGGRLICSTYGSRHMFEIGSLVSGFDSRIALAADNLFNNFGKENGADILAAYYKRIKWIQYEDSLIVTEPEALISYILSCHGNQNRYIIDRHKEFKSYVKKKTAGGFYITKDSGVFIAEI